MKAMVTSVKENKGLFLVYLIFLLAFGAFQLMLTQEELFLYINESHNSFFDTFFFWITYLGDGLFFVALIVVLLFHRYWQALLGIIVFLSSSLLAQLLKRLVFSGRRRPFAELADQYDLYSVPDVDHVMTLSFPSGHTVTAFALAVFVATTLFTPKWGWFFSILAVLVGISRVYLGQHYIEDIYFGSMIGVLMASLVVTFFQKPLQSKFNNKSVLNR